MVSKTLDERESKINELQAELLGEHLYSKKCLDINDEMNIGDSILKHKESIDEISFLFINAEMYLDSLPKSERPKHEKRYDELQNRFETFSSILSLYDDN